ncbi:MAG: 3-deoxy-8-phosphooctulonate synthase [Deltaproteobacteria bacterium]|nr:3-deoxy-8-phosphooctulonate synthase [Deltaproteobacteria bacterium]
MAGGQERAAPSRAGIDVGAFRIGGGAPLVVIAGPCVIESRESALRHGEQLARIARDERVGLVYKSSYDKANRTSGGSFRGIGRDAGLAILEEVRRETGLPVLTDVHEKEDAAAVAAVVDVLQTPAFLCRQTDFIEAVAATGRPVNLKKGQFLSPWEMHHVVDKARATGNDRLLVTERGASFGYQNLVSDMRSLVVLAETGCPVVFDATHSVQLPGAAGGASGGQREFVPALARAAVAVGVDALFLEVHEDPSRALSDGATSWPIERLRALLRAVRGLDEARRASLAEGSGEGGR